MQITTTVEPGNLYILEICGSIDGSTAPQLRDAIIETAQPERKLLLDLKGVNFMSSAGLRVMLLLHRQLQHSNSRVVLVGLVEPIYDAMEATGFLRYFATAPDLDSARDMLE
jgi:anti-sigma B factor antagonist